MPTRVLVFEGIRDVNHSLLLHMATWTAKLWAPAFVGSSVCAAFLWTQTSARVDSLVANAKLTRTRLERLERFLFVANSIGQDVIRAQVEDEYDPLTRVGSVVAFAQKHPLA